MLDVPVVDSHCAIASASECFSLVPQEHHRTRCTHVIGECCWWTWWEYRIENALRLQPCRYLVYLFNPPSTQSVVFSGFGMRRVRTRFPRSGSVKAKAVREGVCSSTSQLVLVARFDWLTCQSYPGLGGRGSSCLFIKCSTCHRSLLQYSPVPPSFPRLQASPRYVQPLWWR